MSDADHDGAFGAWRDYPQPCHRRRRHPLDAPRDAAWAPCGARVQVRQWESDDGAYEDFQYRCAAGHTWWIDGMDA